MTIATRSTLDVLNAHVSIRQYSDEPVTNETVRAILNAARRSPTSSNLQAYTFIVVRDPATKQVLAELSGGQKQVANCPVFIAICADVARLRTACAMHGTTLAQNLENTLIATVDAAIAGMSLATAAESLGLGTVMIGGMRNKPAEAATALGLPDGVYVVYGMCLGYPLESAVPEQKPRLPEEMVIHYERYDASDPTPGLRAYDAQLAAHYRSEGRNTPDEAWTGIIAQRFSQIQRPHLRATLEAMGWRFD